MDLYYKFQTVRGHTFSSSAPKTFSGIGHMISLHNFQYIFKMLKLSKVCSLNTMELGYKSMTNMEIKIVKIKQHTSKYFVPKKKP